MYFTLRIEIRVLWSEDFCFVAMLPARSTLLVLKTKWLHFLSVVMVNGGLSVPFLCDFRRICWTATMQTRPKVLEDSSLAQNFFLAESDET